MISFEKPKHLVVKQSHAITDARYKLNPVLRKLVHLVMSKAQTKNYLEMTAVLPVSDVIRYLEMDDGGKTYVMLRQAVEDEAMKSILTVPTEDGYVKHQWFSWLKYNDKNDTIELCLHHLLHAEVIKYQEGYTLMPINHIAKLKGRHSLRIYEQVMSQCGNEGVNGNAPGTWFWYETIRNIRLLFGVLDSEYKKTNDLRKKIIDAPIVEINSARIGIEITPEYVRKKQALIAVKFVVKRVSESDLVNVTPRTEAETEEAKLIEAYPNEWARYLAEAREIVPLPGLLLQPLPEYQHQLAVTELRKHVAALGQSKAKRRASGTNPKS